MGLIQCPDCGKGVSEIAEQCPNCGRPIANITPGFSANGKQSNSVNIFSTDLKNVPGLLFVGLVAAIFFGIWTSSVAPKETQVYSPVPRKAAKTENTTSKRPEITSKINITTIKWYEDGNLHQKTLKEWSQATQANKMATCADFAVSHPRIKSIVTSKNSLDAAKPYAIQLVTAIDEVAKDKRLGRQKVSEIAAASMVLMKW